MSTASKIEWTETTWNPATGCDRISPGCDNCYALTLAKRLKAMGNPKYQADGDPRTSGPGFGVTVHEAVLDLPRRWRIPRMVFVDSMSDLSVGIDGASAAPWVALPLVRMATGSRRGARQMSGMWLPVSPSSAMGDFEQAKFTHPLSGAGPRVIGGVGGPPRVGLVAGGSWGVRLPPLRAPPVR